MNTETERQPTCAERVGPAAESRLSQIRAMLDPEPGDLVLESLPCHDSTAAVPIPATATRYRLEIAEYEAAELTAAELRDAAESLIDPSDLADYHMESGDLDDPERWPENFEAEVMAELFDRYQDQIHESSREAWDEYGLCFDYVEPGTDFNPGAGYWRYQISWGGPSEEIRFFASQGHRGWHLDRAEFWFLDWFDGAHVDVTNDERARAVWDDLAGLAEYVMTRALED